MDRIEVGRVTAGRGYAYQGLQGGGTRYRVRGFCRHAQHRDDKGTYQELVLYEGQDGADRGLLWVCTLADFALRFRPVSVAPPEPPAEKVAGIIPDSPGY